MPRKPRKPKKLCSVPGCTRVSRARGLCTVHYKRERRTGAPGRPQISRRTGANVRADVVLPFKAWERLAGQGRPFSELAREILTRAAARLPDPDRTTLRSKAPASTGIEAIDFALDSFFGARIPTPEAGQNH